MLSSRLFRGDPVLEAVDAGTDRVSETSHATHPAVAKIQSALLLWDGRALPKYGADGIYGDETAKAVVRYKETVLLTPPPVYRDVGPLTVQSLDARQAAHEATLDINARRVQLDAWLQVPLDGYSTPPVDAVVVPHASGESALRALRAAIDGTTGPSDLIVLAGWAFQMATFLDAGVTVEDSLRAASARGVPIRALFTSASTISIPFVGDVPVPGGGSDNTWSTQFIRSLPTGLAIHDSWVLHADLVFGAQVQTGSHHQKIWAIAHGDTLTTFIGGIDIDPTRSPFNQVAGVSPWHDVQLETRGDLATDVFSILRDRWNAHPQKPPGSDLPTFLPPGTGGNQVGRALATFGDPTAFAGLAGPPYPFAPRGSKAIRRFLSHAISRAEKFIYLEDQYLVDASIGVELAARMPELDGLAIVIPHDNAVNGEMRQAARRRSAVLAPLAPFMDKVAVNWSAQFVHSKLWIFDDQIAVVGSANSNRRGYSHDSEADVAFGDLVVPGAVEGLRSQLWTRALGTIAPAALASPLTSIGIWKSASFAAGAHVETYVPGVDTEPVPAWASPVVSPDEFWNRVIDPEVP